MKIILKLLLTLLFILLMVITYLSIFGVETTRFNNQIINKLKSFDKNIDIQLKTIKIVFDPLSFRINAKTIGSKLINKNNSIEIESLKTKISLKALIEKQFSIENLEVSTKSSDLNDFISFVRSLNQSPELYILDKIIKKGFLIADIKLEFDSQGKIKDNFKINGFIKDGKLSFNNKYSVDKLNFIFDLEKNELVFKDTKFKLNDLDFYSNNLSVKNIENKFFVIGEIDHQKFDLDGPQLDLFKSFFGSIEAKELIFSSKNIFSFHLSKKFKLNNLEIISKINLIKLSILNNLSLKDFFPKIKDKIYLSNNNLEIKYKKEKLSIIGEGKILLQDNDDKISYQIERKNDDFKIESVLKIDDNPFTINLLNYEKKKHATINIKGSIINNQNIINSFILREDNNFFSIKNLRFNKNNQIKKIDKFDLNYLGTDGKKNSVSLLRKDKEYILKGSYFNVDNLLENILNNENENSNILNINNLLKIDINKVGIDKNNYLSNLKGSLVFKKQQIVKGKLEGFFSKNEKLKLTVNTSGNNKVTTLFLDQAKPIVRRYKFIKGFEGGKLDFYSSSNGEETLSTLKIYNFKLKELPGLTKILTLASLQGIADILSGEGIGFDEFEMNFRNKKDLMTIDEIYAIGPAISVLMNGYIEKNRLISLRGTLVPATTINKFIGSLTVLGDILVGSKTGEGVFGVSFKIKGPPKKLETTVNPVKTLTPRFITRTLEKLKKTNLVEF